MPKRKFEDLSKESRESNNVDLSILENREKKEETFPPTSFATPANSPEKIPYIERTKKKHINNFLAPSPGIIKKLFCEERKKINSR